MKVYCRNCKHVGWTGGDWCDCPRIRRGNKYSGITYWKGVVRKSEENKNGDCKTYKRKRWKFWIK